MGKISQGVLGGFSGKVGNVVGGTWKGIDYMRIKPANVSNPRTAGQVDQRSKFSTTLKFLQSMTDFLRVGFKLYANKMTQFNAAMSYNLNNAITGSYPNFTIDYANALVSRGGLVGAANAAVSSSGGLVEFTWDDNTGSGNAQATDKALLVVYNPTKDESIYDSAGAVRSATSQNLGMPASYVGDDVEAFIGFLSEDGKEVANSVYIGSVTVA
ncbi:DUF6266 family protein [Acidiluteibacter ferrifornacis]|jgi:hypothetical protein|uniref:Uncharacterized protein n=1 Tax=Acidiluteibacter ferrifornacis TaxID=2692424 RepID=A0A6N9NMI6_9FLAO|nr:DUF6266 family protein [Acidiluteibacter ferrifornacis]NBG66430.1 hypothetical protein [Acidiluteibacter ferrifornacis]